MTHDLKDVLHRLVRLEDVIRRYQPLERAGSSGNSLIGLCPFHADRHPSLHVHVGKQYYKCFACGEGGDLFKYVMRQEGCGFREALEKIAGWYGILPDVDPHPIVPQSLKEMQIREKDIKIYTVLERDNQYRQNRMMQESLTPYVPENKMLQSVYSQFEVSESSSFVPHGFEKMSHRIIFPIRDEEGRLAGFAARYKGEPTGTIAKYINSANNAVYQKSTILYGLWQAKKSICDHGYVYLTEGYKDVLAMHAAGYRNTIALCGTALTVEQVALLRKYTTHAVVLLDGDRRGQEAAARAANLLQSASFTISFLTLEPSHDPDSLCRSMGLDTFSLYIQKQTRYCRLETYEKTLYLKLGKLLDELELALTMDERMEGLKKVMKCRKRLGRVTERLEYGVVSVYINKK